MGLLVYTYLDGGLATGSNVLLSLLRQEETWETRLASHVRMLSFYGSSRFGAIC